jgi:hypothetical protein
MASLFALKPRASSSFLRILPGCVGNLFMFMILSFVVICHLDVVGIPIPPLKTNPPGSVDRYCPLAFPVPLQGVKVDALQWRNIRQLSSRA